MPGRVWWRRPSTPMLRTQRQVNCTEFETNLGKMQSLWKVQRYPSLKTVNKAPILSVEAHRADYKQTKSESSPPHASANDLCPLARPHVLEYEVLATPGSRQNLRGKTWPLCMVPKCGYLHSFTSFCL